LRFAGSEGKLRIMSHSAPDTVRWYHYVAFFFGGAFLANFVPHFVNGVSGSPFQSPFASPPGEGLSSSTVNAAWGLVNLFIAYLLLARVGSFKIKSWSHFGVCAAGFIAMSMMLANHFGKFHGGLR
jgi:hypothetical protein